MCRWSVGKQELVSQVSAAWMVIGDDDIPLTRALVGKAGGSGKRPWPTTPAGPGRPSPFSANYGHETRGSHRNPVISDRARSSTWPAPHCFSHDQGRDCTHHEGNRIERKELGLRSPHSWTTAIREFHCGGHSKSEPIPISGSAHHERRCQHFRVPEYIHSRFSSIFIDFPEKTRNS